MSYVVELVFNELGTKVCGTNKKVFHLTDARSIEEITKDYIDEHLFPVRRTNLVDHIHIYNSFMDCEVGEYLKAKRGDEVFLMRYYGLGWHKDTFAAQRADGQHEVIEFHADGVECTHRKNKIVLSRCTPEEVEEIKRRVIVRPFIDALVLLTNNVPGVTLDASKITLPEWMDERKANEFFDLVDDFIASAG